MKRIIALSLAAIMMIAVFAGCGSDKKESSDKSVTAASVLAEINKQYPDAVGKFTEIKDKSDLKRYYSIDASKVVDFAGEINSKDALEIVIIKGKDSDARADIESKLTIRYNSLLSQYASYDADRLKMAKACGVTEVGDEYAVLVLAENYDDIKSLIEDKLG